MPNDVQSRDSQPHNQAKKQSRFKHLSNNVEFSEIHRELDLQASDDALENAELPKTVSQLRPRHHRSISDFIRPAATSATGAFFPEISSFVDAPNQRNSTIQAFNVIFSREMSDINDDNGNGNEMDLGAENEGFSDESDSAEEREIDPAKVDTIQLGGAAVQTLSADPEETEPHTILGSFRDAVTASVRLAMDSRLAVRRNRHQMFRSLQKQAVEGDGIMAADLVANAQNVFDQQNYRQCLQHPNLRPLGILEVKRLWCALRFLIETKNVEQFLKKSTLNNSPVANGSGDLQSPMNGPAIPLDSTIRDVTLHYSHRFSSTSDVHLAPSLEVLMRQQTLASKPRYDSNTQPSTLVNRHSLPSTRRISGKGLNGQDFRRASVAGTETHPKLDALGLNSDSISSSIPDHIRKKENDLFNLIFERHFKPELERTISAANVRLPPLITVRPYEKRLYKNLCAFLLACLSIEEGDNKYMMKLIQTTLSYLRSIEECESSRVCKGFVNKIDNYLAILLFRSPNVEDDIANQKTQVPFMKTFHQSKSNALSSRVTEDLAASITSDSQQLATSQPRFTRSFAAKTASESPRLFLSQVLVIICGLGVLLGVWRVLYLPSIETAYDQYGQQLSTRIASSLAVDRLAATLALNIPKEIMDDYTKYSRFDTLAPHLALMASNLPTVGIAWLFLPDSGAFAAAIRVSSGQSIEFIERKTFISPCYRFNASTTWRRVRNRNTTVICPSAFGINTSSQNWSTATSIDGSPSTYGFSQSRSTISSQRTIILGMHFTMKLINESFDKILIRSPKDVILLRDLFSGKIISGSKAVDGTPNQTNSVFRIVHSPTQFVFANTTAEVVIGVTIPPPYSNITFSTVILLIACAVLLLLFWGSWMRPYTTRSDSIKRTELIRTVVDELPSRSLRKEHLHVILLVLLTSCIVMILLLFISSDQALQIVSDATWQQLGATLHEKFRLLPALAQLISSTVVLQLTDGSINVRTYTTRLSTVTADALVRLVQMPSEAMLAYSVGVYMKDNLYGTHLPNMSNPDPKTFSFISLQREVDVTQSSWYRYSNASGMFGNVRRLVNGDVALPYGKSVNVTGFGRCVILVDFGTEILSKYLQDFVAQIGLKSIALEFIDYPSLDTLTSFIPSNVAQYILSPALDKVKNNIISRNPVFDRDTLALTVPYSDAQASWILNAVVSLHEVCGPISELSLTAWIIFLGITVIVLFLVYISSWNLQRRHCLFWSGISDADAIIALAKDEPSRAALTHHLVSIRSKIISASGQSWKRKCNLRSGGIGDFDQPLDFEEIQNHVSERAVRHVRDALHNRNILTLCELESRESPVAVGLYKLISHNFTSTVLFVIAIVHIGLQFFEPQTPSELAQNGNTLWVLITEGVCLIFEIAYLSCYFGLKTQFLTMENILSRVENSFAVDVTTVLILSLTCLDWLLTMTVNLSFEYACPLRPWIFLLFFADLRRGLSLFIRAIIRAFDVILLWMSIIFIFALFGVLLFKSNLNLDTNISSFGNVRDALITCFVFASTADNFSDLIYNASQENPLFMLFFVVLWMIGMFCILAMVVGCFQHEFMLQQNQNVQQKTLITRTGIIAAFILIDVDQSGGISVEEFKDFISGCANHDAAATRRAFIKMFRNIDTNGDGQMDIYEFVMGIEDLSLHRLFLGRRRPAVESNWKKWMRENVFFAPSDWWRTFIEVLLLVEITAACTYGIVDDVTAIDLICYLLLIFFTMEMFTKMIVYGPTEMIIHGRYDGSMFERRFDTIIVFGAFITFYLTKFTYSSHRDHVSDQDLNLLRILQLVPITRIFSQVKIIRHVITTFLRSAREFLNLFCLLLIIMDIYACIGVYLFSGLWNDPENPQANFDNHSNAFISLIECMVQQDWRHIMYHAISTYGWSASLYFISFTFLISILFTNLFLGIILTQFSKIVQHKRESKAALQKPMLNQSQRALFDGNPERVDQ